MGETSFYKTAQASAFCLRRQLWRSTARDYPNALPSQRLVQLVKPVRTNALGQLLLNRLHHLAQTIALGSG